MAKKGPPDAGPDRVLRDALQKAYAARAKLFYTQVKALNLDSLFAKVRAADGQRLDWDERETGVSNTARETIQNAGIPLHHVFAHPDLLAAHPDLLDYYRSLAALSQKGLSQLVRGSADRQVDAACAINAILSSIIEADPAFSLSAARDVMLAEAGAEIQGSWVNRIGAGASKAVAEMLNSYASCHGLSTKAEETTTRRGPRTTTQFTIYLKNGWRIVFSSEPDVAVYDDQDGLRAAIEIKGSMDKAGAQTRYGEAKKSFGKALSINPRCETIYLASCFTESVLKQIQADGQVRKTFNLVDILHDETEQENFLKEIFTYLIRIEGSNP